MPLRTKLLAILAAVVLLFSAGMFLIQQGVILPSFVVLENELATRNLARVRRAVGNEVEHLDAFTADWARRDDTYEFVAAPTDRYAEYGFSKSYFASGSLTAAYVVDLSGRVVWRLARDPLNQYERTTIQCLSSPTWPLDHPLLANRDITKGTAGLIATEHGPMMIASRPIITSPNQGPLRGWLVSVKQITPDIVQGLREQTEVDFDLLRYAASELEAREQSAVVALNAGAEQAIERLEDRRVSVYGSLRDLSGKPILLVRAWLSGDVSARGAATLDFALLSIVGASVVLLVVLVGLLQRFVVSPVARLTAHAVAIGASDDLLARLNVDRNDELGVLAREFDSMVDRLAESRTKLVDVARLGGRSEVATSVLHNVGNALNSVNVSKDVLRSKLAGVDEKTLEQLLGLLLAHQDDLGQFITSDPAGRHLPRFLKALVENLSRNQRSARVELAQLGEGLEHLRALVAAQQEFAGAGGVAEFTALPELLESAIRVASAKPRSPGIAIERDFEAGLPLIKLQKHKLLEALVNLLGNACEAVAASERSDKRVRVRMRRCGPKRLRFQIEDNGVGISPDNLPRLFSYGFTTKPGGHGFGLHASANVIREMGGEVAVTSEGVGCGACFTVEVPFEEEVAAQSATPGLA